MSEKKAKRKPRYGLYCWKCDKPTGNTDECPRCVMIRIRSEARDVRNVEDPPYSPLLDGPPSDDEGFGR